MGEWILFLMFVLNTQGGGVASQQVDNFKTQAACMEAAKQVVALVKPEEQSILIVRGVCIDRNATPTISAPKLPAAPAVKRKKIGK